MRAYIVVILSALSVILVSSKEQCGWQADEAPCPAGQCCSRFGYCGSTDDYCLDCQSQCDRDPYEGAIISADQFNQMLLNRNDSFCPASGFYTYEAFIEAADSFDGFGTTGDDETQKREIAAFLGQTSHETSGGWDEAPDGPYTWGYCYKEVKGNPPDYCSFSLQWPCVPGKKYYGRGPMRMTYNYNYGAAGRAIGVNLLRYPDLVASDPTISFKTAIWYWMTPQWPKPSSHDVITGRWHPNPADALAGRHPGYGTITNIINGGSECGHGYDASATDRVGFYKRYCHILGVSPGTNLDCDHQLPFVPHIAAI